MARKKISELTEEKVVSEPITEVAVEESEAKKNFIAMIETYKQKNPVKYESKKAQFEEQLKNL